RRRRPHLRDVPVRLRAARRPASAARARPRQRDQSRPRARRPLAAQRGGARLPARRRPRARGARGRPVVRRAVPRPARLRPRDAPGARLRRVAARAVKPLARAFWLAVQTAHLLPVLLWLCLRRRGVPLVLTHWHDRDAHGRDGQTGPLLAALGKRIEVARVPRTRATLTRLREPVVF